jgi:DNA polymerase III epsilon subunit-like protein
MTLSMIELQAALSELSVSTSGNKKELLKRYRKQQQKKSIPPPRKDYSIIPSNAYFLVVDFECTCEEDSPADHPYEIIEFPVIVVHKGKEIGTFHEFVRPTHNTTLSSFCTKLTGITQDTVDKADTFDIVFARFQQFLTDVCYPSEVEEETSDDAEPPYFAFVSDGFLIMV